MGKIKKILNKSHAYKKIAGLTHRLIVHFNPKIEMRRIYKATFKREPDLDNPTDLIEKIYWLQLHTDTSLWTKCADKYLMREYIKECGFSSHLPTLYAKWDSVNEVNFDGLPNSFILKTNNGCAQNIIVDKAKDYSIKDIKQSFKRWLRIPYGYAGAQLHYTKIKPCIIAEELLASSEEDRKISPNSLIDYKVWCFRGKPECILVTYNRHDGRYVNFALFDLNWNSISDFLINTSLERYDPNVEIPRPICLEELLKIASKVSEPFPEVRVDFYVMRNKPIIGELTFTTGYGYFTEDYYKYLGDKVDLSKYQKGK